MKLPEFDPEGMRDRIRAEIKRQGRSQGSVAEAASLGHGYLTNVLVRNQIPSVDKLDALCRELKVSMAWVMYGIEIPADFERVFVLMQKNPTKFYALLELLD